MNVPIKPLLWIRITLGSESIGSDNVHVGYMW